MSTIAAGITPGTALVSTANTDGTLQLQVNGTTPAVTLNTAGAMGVGSTPAYGTSGQVLVSNGVAAAPAWTTPASGGSLLRVTVFTTSGTWTKGAGTNYIKVYGVGGGGGGGGVRDSVARTGGGGGGGGYFQEQISTSGVTTVTVTIGAAGAGVSAASGTAGGTTSFGAYASANGGSAGLFEIDGTAAGGTATGGDINITGQRGSVGAGTGNVPGGLGGSSMLGGGGAMRSSNFTGAGYAGTGYGSGGGGAANNSFGGGDQPGGAGTSGIVIVEEYA